nr:C5 protein defective [Cotton leaf curl Burewala virus]
MNILHSRRTGLIIKHIKYLSKILRFINRSTISNQEKHHTIRVILRLNVLIHPDLTQHINRLNTKSLTNSMGQPSTTSNITNTHYFTYMLNIMSGLKRLNLTWTFTSSRNIWTSVHPVHPGLSVHGPVRPCFCFGDADNGGSSTARVWLSKLRRTMGAAARHTYAYGLPKLRRYRSDPSQVIPYTEIELQTNMTYSDEPVKILAREVKKLRNKQVPLVKVFWHRHGLEEATWTMGQGTTGNSFNSGSHIFQTQT